MVFDRHSDLSARTWGLLRLHEDLAFVVWCSVVHPGVAVLYAGVHGDWVQPSAEWLLLDVHVTTFVVDGIHQTERSFDRNQHAVLRELVLLVLLLSTHHVKVLAMTLRFTYLEFSALNLEVLLDSFQVLVLGVGCHAQFLH